MTGRYSIFRQTSRAGRVNFSRFVGYGFRRGGGQTMNAIREFCVVAEGSTAGEIAGLCPAMRIVMLTVSKDDDVQHAFVSATALIY